MKGEGTVGSGIKEGGQREDEEQGSGRVCSWASLSPEGKEAYRRERFLTKVPEDNRSSRDELMTSGL